MIGGAWAERASRTRGSRGPGRSRLGRLAAALALAWGAALPARAADERPPVIVTHPGAEAYRIAVQRFASQADASSQKQASALRQALEAGLAYSSLFVPLRDEAFLGPVETASLGAAPACSDWRQGGADALLAGRLVVDAKRLAVEAELWDLARCRRMLRKRYRTEPRGLERLAKRIADDVVGAFTGTPGVASTEIAFVSTRSGSPEVFVMEADGSHVRQLTHNRSINAFPDWAPDASAILYMSYRYRRRPGLFLLARGGAAAGLFLPRDGLGGSFFRGVFDPSGHWMAVVRSIDGTPEIYRVSRDGTRWKRLTRNRSIDVAPTWSPDGRWLAFVSDRAGSPQIYVMDRDGGHVRRLTFDGSYNAAPAWSPDGRWIAYETRVEGQFDIWLLDPEGQVNVPLVTHPRSDEHPSWSPDGRKLAFHSTRRGRADVYVIDVDGSHLRRLTHGEGDNRSPDWGPYPR